MPGQKPEKNLHFEDPSVKKIMDFVEKISTHYGDEYRSGVTIRVLQTLAYIKLNYPLIKYAVSNKHDKTIYVQEGDDKKQVLRSPNGMSFHVLGYTDGEKAISDYAEIVSTVEAGVDLMGDDPEKIRLFIRKIDDSIVGCMEARITEAIAYLGQLGNPPKLDDLFLDFTIEQEKQNIDSSDIPSFFRYLTQYFDSKINTIVTHEGKTILLTWNMVKDYLDSVLAFDRDNFIPSDLFQKVKQKKYWFRRDEYVFRFESEEEAEKQLNLIKISLPNELYPSLREQKIVAVKRQGRTYWQFKLNEAVFDNIFEQFEAASFAKYAENLRKLPHKTLRDRYLKHLLQKNSANLTPIEIKYIHARKLWSDVVSQTYEHNQAYLADHNVKEEVISRLRDMGANDPETLYEACINLIKAHSVITVAFSAYFLKYGELTDTQLLNLFERQGGFSCGGYARARNTAEQAIFNFLPEELKQNFYASSLARPRYGALSILRQGASIEPASMYGDSSIVLRELVKHNSVFLPGAYLEEKHSFQPCTIHNLEILLSQLSDDRLYELASKASRDAFGSGKEVSRVFHRLNYVEAMIPAVPFLDANWVESIYVSNRSHQISEEDLERIQALGINVINTPTPIYRALWRALINAIKGDNDKIVEQLLNEHPSLALMRDKTGDALIHIATKHGATKTIQRFSEMGFNLSEYATDQCSPLQKAAQAGYVGLLKFLVSIIHHKTKTSIPDLLDESINANTALHLSIKAGQVETTRYLIEQGASLEATNKVGMTPVEVAVATGNADVIKVLFRINVSAVDIDEGESLRQLFKEPDTSEREEAANTTTDKYYRLLIQHIAKEHPPALLSMLTLLPSDLHDEMLNLSEGQADYPILQAYINELEQASLEKISQVITLFEQRDNKEANRWELLCQIRDRNPQLIDSLFSQQGDIVTCLYDTLRWRMNQPLSEPYETIFDTRVPFGGISTLFVSKYISLKEYIQTQLLNAPSDKEKLLKVFAIYKALEENNEEQLVDALNIQRGWKHNTSCTYLYESAKSMLDVQAPGADLQ